VKASKIGIPGVYPRSVTEHPNNKYRRAINNNGLTVIRDYVQIPVLNIIFNDQDSQKIPPDIQADNLRNYCNRVARFYLENSYGEFQFEFILRTAILNMPKTWRGNVHDTPQYGADGNLTNPDDFPNSEDYTGFDSFVIFLNRDDKKTWCQNYNAMAERNYCEAALIAAQVQTHDWDDPGAFEDWINFGIPDGETYAYIIFTSRSLSGGGNRSFGTWLPKLNPDDPLRSKNLPLSFGDRTLHNYIFMDSKGQWEVMAHAGLSQS